ncbi:MAG TPA: hypothetical protein VJ276_08555 [Thermoanaerobaculia bacterium]|nr:hypothetical protein [Thermoanaerobaculia bacterium]
MRHLPLLAIAILVAGRDLEAAVSRADLIREFITPRITEAVRTLECPETAGAGKFECRGETVTGKPITVHAELVPEGQIYVTAIDVGNTTYIVRGETSQTNQILAFAAIMIGGGLVMAGIIALVHLNAAVIISRHPFVPEQRVSFDAPGAYVLNTDGAPWTLTPLQCSLHEAATGAEVTGYRILKRGMSAGGVARRRFFVRTAGEHVLRAAVKETPTAAFVFTRSPRFRGGWWIAGIVIGGVLGLYGLLLLL